MTPPREFRDLVGFSVVQGLVDSADGGHTAAGLTPDGVRLTFFLLSVMATHQESVTLRVQENVNDDDPDELAGALLQTIFALSLRGVVDALRQHPIYGPDCNAVVESCHDDGD